MTHLHGGVLWKPIILHFFHWNELLCSYLVLRWCCCWNYHFWSIRKGVFLFHFIYSSNATAFIFAFSRFLLWWWLGSTWFCCYILMIKIRAWNLNKLDIKQNQVICSNISRSDTSSPDFSVPHFHSPCLVMYFISNTIFSGKDFNELVSIELGGEEVNA